MLTPEQPNLYQGKQAIINSDRILFNAKTDENVSSLPLMLQAKDDSTSVHFFASVEGAETFADGDLTFVFGIEYK